MNLWYARTVTYDMIMIVGSASCSYTIQANTYLYRVRFQYELKRYDTVID